MKKILCVLIGICLGLLPAACGRGQPELPVPTEVLTTAEEISATEEETTTGEAIAPALSIALATDDLLASIAVKHELDYTDVRIARDGSVGDDDPIGDTLIIRTNVPLREFAVVLIGNDTIEEELVFIPIETFGAVELFTPEAAFVIRSYLGLGSIPWSGITFIDSGGQRHYYAIAQNQSDEGDPYFLFPFEDRTDELP